MSAETLRRAASLMRERAEATYLTTDDGSLAAWHTPEDLVGTFEEDGDGDYIASWHPAVALAVADLLDREADIEDELAASLPWSLTVARAYLGESA